MCGISGVIVKSASYDGNLLVRLMNSKIPHRGPDCESYYENNLVHFGHKRLSIIDLTDSANQPFIQGDYVIIYNGEVYNYIELREELKKLGSTFKTNSDTEVVLNAYIKWGENCLSKFNGMWAFAIFDKTKNLVFCSRDRFGVKPFYFTNQDDFFAFGSEIKQLLTSFKSINANIKTVVNFLVAGLEDYSENTFFQGIFQLKPGHALSYNLNSNKFQIRKYYTLEKKSEFTFINLKNAKEVFLTEFERSIRYRLRSDVNVGTCLSGGLDSSSVAAIASKIYKKETGNKFLAFTASSLDQKNDEYDFAKIVAENYPIKWHVVKPDIESFKSVIDKVVYHLDEPFASPSIFMQYFVMKMIREAKCTVVLDGQGGDETFLGYERYFPLALGSLFSPTFWPAVKNVSNNSKLSFLDVIKYKFYFTNFNLRYRTLKNRNKHLKKSFFDFLEIDLLKDLSNSFNDLYELQHFEITQTQLPHLLKYEDRNSMAFSIEARLPFLDYKLVEFAYSLPIELKLNNGWTKKIIRDSMTGILPNEIAWRKNKIGFEAPRKIWMNELNEIDAVLNQSDILKHIFKQIPIDYYDLNQKWKLYNIALWEKKFNVTL
jgi:asparagine synthase (glutamine-hydrolysing)